MITSHTNRKYKVIYADPPWKYNNPKNNNPALGGKTYPTLSLPDICSMDVPKLADKDCALFLWATMPKLPEALTVMMSWGFTFTTVAFTWVKLDPMARVSLMSGRTISKKKTYDPGDGIYMNDIYSGLGHWTNGNAELVLFGKRGKPVRCAKDVKQVVVAPRGSHSEKPDEVRARISVLMGDVSRCELFARKNVKGWHSWGNEVKPNPFIDPILKDTYEHYPKSSCIFENSMAEVREQS